MGYTTHNSKNEDVPLGRRLRQKGESLVMSAGNGPLEVNRLEVKPHGIHLNCRKKGHMRTSDNN